MSEIAKIRARIDEEIAAMNLAIQGYAVTARHDIVSSRYANLETCQQALAPHLGEQGALEVIIKALENLDTDTSPHSPSI
jgi:hypothetical protein